MKCIDKLYQAVICINWIGMSDRLNCFNKEHLLYCMPWCLSDICQSSNSRCHGQLQFSFWHLQQNDTIASFLQREHIVVYNMGSCVTYEWAHLPNPGASTDKFIAPQPWPVEMSHILMNLWQTIVCSNWRLCANDFF